MGSSGPRVRGAGGVPVEVLSHVAVSRGRLPDPRARIVIIDESHHFRHPYTQRYPALARWIQGRPVLCVTATPVVNRAEDLAYQLQLGARDDVLRAHGTPSLRDALRRGEVPSALGELVVATPAPEGIPGRREIRHRWGEGDSRLPAWLDELDALTLDGGGGTARLIRSVLWGAAASSPAALRATLGRYALLLRQALDARRAGMRPDRAALRSFAGEIPEQLLFWELLPIDESVQALPVEDLERVERLRAAIDLTAADPKADRLAALLADRIPTLVFTTSVATVPYLRERLHALAPAWITGARAGWQRIRLPRDRVLEWFQPAAAAVTPYILLASDVAAEGLDLQRARRIVHYDLPWTAMRLAQREGRSRRLGATHPEVTVVRMEPPPWIERRLRVTAVLRRKEGLLARAGLSGEGAEWRWRHDLAAEWADRPGRPGIAAFRGTQDRLLIAFTVEKAGQATPQFGHVLLSTDGAGRSDGPAIGKFLTRIEGARSEDPSEFDQRTWSERCLPALAQHLRYSAERDWSATLASPASRALMERVQDLMRAAARDREVRTLRHLEALISFLARGRTAGEELVVGELAAATDEVLKHERPGLRGPEAGSGPATIRIMAAIAEVTPREVSVPR